MVWDLDDTLWDGTIMEDPQVVCSAQLLALLRELDQRGILLSIASRNEWDVVRRKLEELGIDDLFLHAQVGWGSKSESISIIARELGIGLDSIAFVDDQPFERDEVAMALPDVLCLAPTDIPYMLQMPSMNPLVLTPEASGRRVLYKAAARREAAERGFSGPSEEFLRSLHIECRIRAASEIDIDRVQELTVRTHQLNSTGYSYSRDELVQLTHSPTHSVMIASLSDRFGDYGSVGVVLLAREGDALMIKLLLVSCRVISRGVGSVLLAYVLKAGQKDGFAVRAEFVPTDRNRIMEITYRLSGFRSAGVQDGIHLLQHDATTPVVSPPSVRVILEE
ncbi:MAG: HAD-IIIC family phosphatase [Gemmatimonadaceae bacterium]